jgi:hypothetical protein
MELYVWLKRPRWGGPHYRDPRGHMALSTLYGHWEAAGSSCCWEDWPALGHERLREKLGTLEEKAQPPGWETRRLRPFPTGGSSA